MRFRGVAFCRNLKIRSGAGIPSLVLWGRQGGTSEAAVDTTPRTPAALPLFQSRFDVLDLAGIDQRFIETNTNEFGVINCEDVR
jgi:hypothetical protein